MTSLHEQVQNGLREEVARELQKNELARSEQLSELLSRERSSPSEINRNRARLLRMQYRKVVESPLHIATLADMIPSRQFPVGIRYAVCELVSDGRTDLVNLQGVYSNQKVSEGTTMEETLSFDLDVPLRASRLDHLSVGRAVVALNRARKDLAADNLEPEVPYMIINHVNGTLKSKPESIRAGHMSGLYFRTNSPGDAPLLREHDIRFSGKNETVYVIDSKVSLPTASTVTITAGCQHNAGMKRILSELIHGKKADGEGLGIKYDLFIAGYGGLRAYAEMLADLYQEEFLSDMKFQSENPKGMTFTDYDRLLHAFALNCDEQFGIQPELPHEFLERAYTYMKKVGQPFLFSGVSDGRKFQLDRLVKQLSAKRQPPILKRTASAIGMGERRHRVNKSKIIW